MLTQALRYLIRSHTRKIAGMSYDVHDAIWAKADLEEGIGVLHAVHEHCKYIIAHNFPPAAGSPSSVHQTRESANVPPAFPIPICVAAVIPAGNAEPPFPQPDAESSAKRSIDDPRLQAMYESVSKIARMTDEPYNPSDDEEAIIQHPPPTPAHE